MLTDAKFIDFTGQRNVGAGDHVCQILGILGSARVGGIELAVRMGKGVDAI